MYKFIIINLIIYYVEKVGEIVRWIAISDVHGCFLEWIKLWNQLHVSKKDQVILLGDFVDRGPQTKDVLQHVYELKQQGFQIQYVRGNHEQSMLDSFSYNQNGPWIRSNGIKTLESYVGQNFSNDWSIEDIKYAKEFIRTQYPHHLELIKDSVYVMQTKKHVFVHAGLDPKFGLKTSSHDMMHIRDGFYRSELNFPFKVVFGHTPIQRLERFREDVWFQADKIGIDGGISFGQHLHALIIDETETNYETITVSPVVLTKIAS